MTCSCELQVETWGGVEDLSRVVGVLALYALTPARLSVRRRGAGLKIAVRLEADERSARLCASRLAVMHAVRDVDVLLRSGSLS